jgi:hypothetical protein
MLDFIYIFLEKYQFINLFKNIFYFGITGALIGILVNPLQFLKIIRQQTGQKYQEIIINSYNKYGIKVFYRGLKSYMILNFLVNAAFGISEFMSYMILSSFNLQFTIFGIFTRILFAASIETIFTAKTEVQTISKYKGDLMKKSGEVSSILASIFTRNIINWMGSLIAIYLIYKFQLSYFYGFFISLIVGMIFAIATLPFDIVATHNCGDIEKLSIFQRLKKISFESGGYQEAYRGSLMRIIMMTCYSIGIVIVERFFIH